MKKLNEQAVQYMTSIYYPADKCTYLEVWLWLAKENIAHIDATYLADGTWQSEYTTPYGDVAAFNDYATQEDAIAAAIDDLIKEDLIRGRKD